MIPRIDGTTDPFSGSPFGNVLGSRRPVQGSGGRRLLAIPSTVSELALLEVDRHVLVVDDGSTDKIREVTTDPVPAVPRGRAALVGP